MFFHLTTGLKQRAGGAFDKDWPANPWEAGSAPTGETGEEPRDVYLVQLPGGGEEEEEDECARRSTEETTNIKEEVRLVLFTDHQSHILLTLLSQMWPAFCWQFI